MFGILMRLRMHRCLSKIEKLCFQSDTGVITGDDIAKLCSSPKNLKAIKALEASQYVSLIWIDNHNLPVGIREGEKTTLYALERSEIWLNRFLGFIAGILTSVLADYIIRLLSVHISP